MTALFLMKCIAIQLKTDDAIVVLFFSRKLKERLNVPPKLTIGYQVRDALMLGNWAVHNLVFIYPTMSFDRKFSL